MFGVLVLVEFAAAACPVARSLPELGAALQAVDRAWADDPADFERYMGDVRAILPCVAEPLDPGTAAHVHRAEALAAFARRDGASVRAAFAAARQADPGFELPDSIAPKDTPLRAEWDSPHPAGELQVLVEPAAGSVRLDGRDTRERASGRPVVFQLVTPDGRVAEGAWVTAGAPVPLYPAPKARPSPLGGWIATGAAAVGSGVCLGLAYGADADYRASVLAASADQRRTTVNGLALGSAGLGAVAIGLGVVAVAASF